MDNEKQTCLRRMQEYGPWERKAFLDTWENNRWNSNDHIKWPTVYKKPHTCSFCGSIHPEDLLNLLKENWRIEQTDKFFKFYLYPPKGLILPIPYAKFYTQHLTTDIIKRSIN